MTTPNTNFANQRLTNAKAALYLALMDVDPDTALGNEPYLTALMNDPEVKTIMDKAFNRG